MTVRILRNPLVLASLAALAVMITLSYPAHGHAPRRRRGPTVLHAVTIDARNRDLYTHILPTGRRLDPVGMINGTPDFPTAVVPFAHGVAVLANGATPSQTIGLYGSDLGRYALLAVYRGKAPGKPTTSALPNGLGISETPRHPAAAGVAYRPKASAAQLAACARRTLRAQAGHASRATTIIGHGDLFQGLAAGPDDTLYAAGGVSDTVMALRRTHGRLQLVRRYTLRWQPFPAHQYPYQYQGNRDGAHLFYPDSVVVGPAGRHLYVAGLLSNSLARIDIASGHTRYAPAGSYPFAVTLADGGRRLVVSDWGGNGVTVIDRAAFRVLGQIATGPKERADRTGAGVHPTALAAVPGTPDVLAADANVDRIVEIDTRTLNTVRILADQPYPDAPPGSYPDGLAVDDGRLFVANAGNNDVAVFDLATGQPLGLIPTGWYPSALTTHGNTLYVVATKGLGSGPDIHYQWVGDLMTGLVQKIPLADLPAKLARWTAMSLQNDGLSRAQRAARHARNVRTAARLRRHIHYVVFILRENKTFDEDFGQYRAAGHWADPHLDLYGPRELPNLYHLAATGTLFVDFLADGEVTAQGHQWTTGASDSDFVQRTWPEYYSQRGLIGNPGWTQSLTPGRPGAHNPYAIYANLSALGHWSNPWISYPGRLYLFNDLLEHHVSFEDFGEFVSRSKIGAISADMRRHLATDFPGWDRMILDTARAQLAINWLQGHPGRLFPRFLYIWLPDDHTAGREPCYYSPDYYVANNDRGTAELIHYLSTTAQWKHMVVFLTEDDAQSGADHIDAHRTFALAAGPWVKRDHLETTAYSQVNIVKTIEAILGLPPLSQWDANAAVLSGLWADHPDFAPVPVAPMKVPVTFNAGTCPDRTLLRREAGATGHTLTARWLKTHTNTHGASLAPPDAARSYTTTSLLKVPGPEQMRQEWIAAKGRRAYERVMGYLRHYARAHHSPLGHYIASDGG